VLFSLYGGSACTGVGCWRCYVYTAGSVVAGGAVMGGSRASAEGRACAAGGAVAFSAR
jgi:hypothetical protein